MNGDTLSLDAIRDCLEGIVPSTVATCAADGTPNVTYASQVDYLDEAHVALSFQFFNKTRENILANPRATVVVTHPQTAASYRLHLEFVRTESAGELFERMKAKLAGIASHTGMAGVFKLRGADVYRVLQIEAIAGPQLILAAPRRNLLAALRSASGRLARAGDLDDLFESALAALTRDFELSHAMLLLVDESGQTLYTVASHGYSSSGVGSEIALGEGIIGVAAEQRTAIRIAHFTEEYSYHRAMRETAQAAGLECEWQREIPFPGLPEPHSQLAVPILSAGLLAGVIYVESAQERRFGYDDEDALVALAIQLGSLMSVLKDVDEDPEPVHPALPGARGGQPVLVRHFAEDDSLFLNEDYLIKGVAGAILWKLLREHEHSGRSEFSNQELRRDPELRLPEVADNLEARLILLSRRLAERCPYLSIEKTGRGRFRLLLQRPLRLQDMPRTRPRPGLRKI